MNISLYPIWSTHVINKSQQPRVLSWVDSNPVNDAEKSNYSHTASRKWVPPMSNTTDDSVTDLGMSVLGSISEKGYLEGGDFFPAGRDLCFIGIGLRSNFDGCQQLMEQDWLGTTSAAIVKDVFDQHQDRMHLDSVFNIIGDTTCVMLEDIMGEASPMRRLVDEYNRDPVTGCYHCSLKDVEFSCYVRSKGFRIIPIKREDQLQYGCNVLNLGKGRLISPNAKSSRQIIRSEYFEGTVEAIDFSSITSMYGAVHCSSQVLKRKRTKRVSA